MNNLMKKVVLLHPQNDASVAQLVEHLTLNQGVQGSTPCGSTKTQTLIDNSRLGFFHAYFWRVFGVIAQKNTPKHLVSGCVCYSISYVEI